MIIEHTSENPVTLGKEPVLLDFYATWCGPCKMTGKYLEEFTSKHPEVTIYEINVDEYPDITEKYSIMSLPTLIYLDTENEIWRHNGLMTTQMLEEKIYG